MSQDRHEQLGLDRIAFFSDAVMAIAITLLVLDLKLPGAEHGDLWSQLAFIQGKLFSFFISFMVVAAFWVSHHRMFTHLQRYDRGLIWLNILLLLFVALVPFSAAIMDVRHMDSQTAVFYSANLIAIGLLRCTMWYYATRKHRLIGAELGKAFIRTELWRALIPPLGFLIMIPVAIVNPQLAGFSWTAIFLLSLFLSGRKSSGS